MIKAGISLISKIFILSISLALINCLPVTAQENIQSDPKQEQEIMPDPIAIAKISSESERLGQRIIRLKTILEPSVKIKEVDSLLSSTSKEIKSQRDTLHATLTELGQRRLKLRLVHWFNYKAVLNGYQDVLSSRFNVLTKTNEELVTELKKWELTKESLGDSKETAEVRKSLENVIEILNENTQTSLERLDGIFVIQKRLTNLTLMVDEAIAEINQMVTKLQKDYFVFDSPGLWEFNKIDSLANDTTVLGASGTTRANRFEITENIGPLKDFLRQNIRVFIFQLIFLIFLFGLMIVVRSRWSKESDEPANQVEREAKVVITHPIASTLVVGLIISLFFYPTLISIFTELHILIILAATAYLLPSLTTRKFQFFLLLIFVVYIFQTIEVYLNPFSYTTRFLFLIEAGLVLTSLVLGRKEIRREPESYRAIKKLFILAAPFFILLMMVSFVANLIGMVNLSRFLSAGVLSSIALGIVVFLSVKIFTSIFVLVFKLRKTGENQAFSTVIKVVQKRLKPILFFIGFNVWLIFTLMGFEMYKYILNYANEMLLISWKIGNLTISLGGILSFSGIFLIAIFLAKLAAAIFHDEWLIQVLPRGIAPAISLLLRIIIITLGLYAGATAAGLDLSKLGFIIGALGVGIGFGLQNVVLNFIAGLILAFERPINLGDTIQVDNEFGVVTDIGVRSSNIRTFAGSEAIIPNGDLISKKVVNWTLSNRDRRTRMLMRTSANADPEKVIQMFNEIASQHPSVYKDPVPMTHFYGFNPDGNLDFALFYWTSFSDTLDTDNDIALGIHKKLKEEKIQAPAPVRRIVQD